MEKELEIYVLCWIILPLAVQTVAKTEQDKAVRARCTRKNKGITGTDLNANYFVWRFCTIYSKLNYYALPSFLHS